jgi:low temperature requirement protein LtrA
MQGRGVTNVELFFDLVYVFAVTQLSHHLLGNPSWTGAGQTAVLLTLVWQAWMYTTWVTNWFDPERIPVRLMLLALALASLVMSAGLPRAFGDRGMWVGATFAGMQLGRTAFVVASLDTSPLRRNFQRILGWCLVSCPLAVLGGFVHGSAREGCWLAAVSAELIGGAVGFAVPGLGRSTTADWTIEGAHFAERCQSFVLIAIGESIVVTGAALSDLPTTSAREVIAVVAAFVGAASLWWIYFDRSAADGARRIAESSDPGRIARTAYHFIHPIMVAGIIVTAAADELVLEQMRTDPLGHPDHATAWMVLGGTALFLAGHAAYKAAVWRVVPASRIAAIVILGLLGLVSGHLPTLWLACLTGVVIVALAASDRLLHSRVARTGY